MPTAILPRRSAQARRKPTQAARNVARKTPVKAMRAVLELSVEEIDLHNEISAAVARDLAR
jgi:formiminotetrahydrofolate cyclodeaminase